MRKAKSSGMKDYLTDRKIAQVGKKQIPKNIGKSIEVNTTELIQNGYTNLGLFLNEDTINSIKTKADNFECYDPFRKELGTFKLSQTPKQVHVANYRRKDLASIKEILDIANNSDILNAAQDFLGATPTISNINMWWSFSGKEQAEQAQLFHRDVDDFRFCKLFIYLTDVEMNNGPHVYVEGSSVSPKLRKIRRYEDSEIYDAFGKEKVKYFTFPKGTAFLVDTYGFHKGLLPSEGKRLLFQVQYSLSPIGIENYEPINIGAHNYDPYINRLILE
ncbi:Phytanoyl-CoA dioxygenase (PhyH) [Winogradskyella thalassocola]|uniref:Phytanoyl-CoA dioxygenase (PhyH) n=2 Tax=Winogradskyella thalassocola TaxID=262004 RepID=A0A1G7WTQ3_9FLAO|nr:Phytanoyl-CoA dioxygenase (PhyH) [Winogradskyella thalassocola]